MEFRQDVGKRTQESGADHPDIQLSGLALRADDSTSAGRFRELEQLDRFGQECLARERQAYVLAIPVEERDLEVFLQLLDAAAHMRLRDPEPLRCHAKMPGSRQGDESPDLSEFHGRLLPARRMHDGSRDDD